MNWYILKAQPNRENHVKENILSQSKIDGIEDEIEAVLVPQEQVIEAKPGGKKRTVKRRFFPGYVFLKTSMTDEVRLLAKKMTFASGFIGDKNPTPMTKREVEKLEKVESSIRLSDEPKYKITFEMGGEVRIVAGPFEGFTGAIKAIDYEKAILDVSLEIFGRDTDVSISFEDIEKD